VRAAPLSGSGTGYARIQIAAATSAATTTALATRTSTRPSIADGSLSVRSSRFGRYTSALRGDAKVRQSSSSVTLEWWPTVVMNRTSLPRTRPDPPYWGS